MGKALSSMKSRNSGLCSTNSFIESTLMTKLLQDLKQPYNAFTTAVALIGVLLSIYFYIESIQKREPYYLAQPSTQIYTKSVTSPKFTVVDSTGKTVDGDIHVLEVSLWNDGRVPIEPSDVRQPVYIEFPQNFRILDSTVVKENKPYVSKVHLTVHPDVPGQEKRIGIAWEHLDPGVGARMQFIYVGSSNPPIKFHGDILDSEIRNAEGLLKRVANESIRSGVAATIVFIAIFLIDLIKIRRIPQTSRLLMIGIGISKMVFTIGFAALMFWLLFIPKSAPV